MPRAELVAGAAVAVLLATVIVVWAVLYHQALILAGALVMSALIAGVFVWIHRSSDPDA